MQGVLSSSFNGFEGLDTVFVFMDGARWRQASPKVHLHRTFMPEARIFQDYNKYYIQVEGMSDAVEVIPDI